VAIKKKVAKKKVVSKKRVAAKKQVAKKAVIPADRTASLKEQLQQARTENRELKNKLRTTERQVQGLLKLLESIRTASDKFLAVRVKEATAKFGILTAPKKSKRRVAKKKVVQKS